MKKLYIALLTVIGLSACSSTEETAKEESTSNTMYAGVELANRDSFTEEEIEKVMAEIKRTGFECKLERTTGSKLGRKKCTTRVEREQLRKMAEERLRKAKSRMTGPAG